MIFHNGRLQALQETDSPYEVSFRLLPPIADPQKSGCTSYQCPTILLRSISCHDRNLLWLKWHTSEGERKALPCTHNAEARHMLDLMRCDESNMQIELRRDGSMKTAGRIEIEGRIRQSFTAHPKIDSNTGKYPRVGRIFFVAGVHHAW